MPILDNLPDGIKNISGTGAVSTITFFIILFIVGVIIGVITYFVFSMIRYKYKVVIFENIGGRGYQPTRTDRAMLSKIGDSGEEVLRLRKAKCYRTAYGKKMGKNVYWFAIADDGYWINITLEDLNKKLKTLNVNPIDRDMRYMSVAIRRNLKERFERTSFLEKYGGLIAYSSLIILTSLGMWLLFDKWLEVSGSLTASMESASAVLEETKRILGTIDTIKS